MRDVDVLMPSLGLQGNDTVKSLALHAPFKFDVITSDVPGWSHAINKCYLTHHKPERDILIIDDDVEILPDTFKSPFWESLDFADVIGFRLDYPDGNLQHDGGFLVPAGLSGHIAQNSDRPSYVAFVTASLCYIRAEACSDLFPQNEWPGVQWEDVALCLDAWSVGRKVLYVPNRAIHKETATKSLDERFWERFAVNAGYFWTKYGKQAIEISMRFGVERREYLD